MWVSLIQSIEGPIQAKLRFPWGRRNAASRLQYQFLPEFPASWAALHTSRLASERRRREKVSYCSVLHPYTPGYGIYEWKQEVTPHSQQDQEKRKERRERGHRKISKVCACLWKWGARIGEHGQTKVGHRRPAAPSYSYHHLLSAHHSLDAALSSLTLYSLTPHNKPSRGGGFVFILQ